MCFPHHKGKSCIWIGLTLFALGVLFVTGYFPWQVYIVAWFVGPMMGGWWKWNDDNDQPSERRKRKNDEQNTPAHGYILLDDGEVQEVR